MSSPIAATTQIPAAVVMPVTRSRGAAQIHYSDPVWSGELVHVGGNAGYRVEFFVEEAVHEVQQSLSGRLDS